MTSSFLYSKERRTQKSSMPDDRNSLPDTYTLWYLLGLEIEVRKNHHTPHTTHHILTHLYFLLPLPSLQKA